MSLKAAEFDRLRSNLSAIVTSYALNRTVRLVDRNLSNTTDPSVTMANNIKISKTINTTLAGKK